MDCILRPGPCQPVAPLPDAPISHGIHPLRGKTAARIKEDNVHWAPKIRQGCDEFSSAFSQCGPSAEEECDVGAQLCRQRSQAGETQSAPPELVQSQEGCCRIPRSAAESGPQRNSLGQGQFHPGGHVSLPLQQPGGAADQVLRSRRRGAAMNLDPDFRIRGDPQNQLVPQVQHLEDGSQLMKPVLPKTQNLQDPVGLGKGGESK